MEKKMEQQREAAKHGGQLHCITPFQPITLLYGGLFPPLLHGNYFPAQRQLQATSATASGPTALAGHCIIYLCTGCWMDTPNPQRLGGRGVSQCHPVHCGRQLWPLGLALRMLWQRVAQGQKVMWVLGITCVGVIVRCVMYSETVWGFSKCPRLCKSQLCRVYCDHG